MTDLAADAALADRLATEAGRLLLGVRDELGFGDGDALKGAGDRRSHEFLLAALTEARPDDAVLSEEGVDDPVRLGAHRVWIVDPVDGTREFGEEGRSDWAVHVALVADGELAVGAVALPALGTTITTAAPPAVPAPAQPLRFVVSRTRAHPATIAAAEALGGVLVPMGSAGAKAMAVVRGEADVYLHAGGQYEWDSAAPVAVAQAAGLNASRIDGTPSTWNQPNPWAPDLLVCHRHLVGPVTEAYAAALAAQG